MKIDSPKEKKVCMVVLNDFTQDSRVLREAKTLREEGYQVFVLAIFSKGLPKEEKTEGAQVIRIFLKTKNLPKKKFFQIFKYIEFTIKSLILILKEKPYVCHCHDLNTLPLGYLAKKILGSYLIYDSHELESQRSTIKREPRWFRWLGRKLEHFLIKRVDGTIVVCDSIADYIKKQDNIERPIVIRNIPDFQNNILNNGSGEHFGFSDEYKIIIYQGALLLNRGLEELIEALKFLDKKIILVIIGEGLLYEELLRIVKKDNLRNRVIFKGYVPPAHLLKLTSQADVGIVPVKKITLSYYLALPNKFFEYIIAGLPVAVSDFPEMRKIVKNYKIGEIFNPESPKSIAEAIRKIFSNLQGYQRLKQNVKQARNYLNWEKERKKLLRIYEQFSER